jgi:preprotein translocase subunit SecD
MTPSFPSERVSTISRANHSADLASATVLLPGLSDSGSNNRYLLGPTQMASSSIAKAVVQYQQFDKQWVVNFTVTKRGTALWNKGRSHRLSPRACDCGQRDRRFVSVDPTVAD